MMVWCDIVAPSDCLSLGPWVFAPGHVCSFRRCASDSSSPPWLVSASAQLSNTKYVTILPVIYVSFKNEVYEGLINDEWWTELSAVPWPPPAGVCLLPDSAHDESWPGLCPDRSGPCGPGSVGFVVLAAWRPDYEFPSPDWTDSSPALTHAHAALMKKQWKLNPCCRAIVGWSNSKGTDRSLRGSGCAESKAI